MATTDARSGFRLPWSSDRSSEPEVPTTEEATIDASSAESASMDAAPDALDQLDAPNESAVDGDPVATDESVPPETDAATVETSSSEAESASFTPTPPAPAAAPAPARKPNKFLADLTKAMQAAAEEARGRSLAQLQADAKTHIETIHARSATEAANLRRQADDDVAAVREWSKTEIARIREETEQRITDRKGRLEGEIEQHAAVIEREIEAVQGTIASFENQMAAFFERLLAEDDPTRFATMAENLPEPPTLEEITAAVHADTGGTWTSPADPSITDVATGADTSGDDSTETEMVATEAVEASTDEPVAMDHTDTDPAVAEATTVDAWTNDADTPAAEPWTDEAPRGETVTDETSSVQEPSGDDSIVATAERGDGDGDGEGEVDREAAFAAIQAAAEAAASAEVAADAAARAEAVADEMLGVQEGEATESGEGADPRFAALGLSPDYAAAEVEAMNGVDGADAEEIPTIGDDALAARLAGLVPPVEGDGSTELGSTQVIVVGLVSVASIASFKRHLGRIAGVQSVGVSSGPDGEFVFAVKHTPETSLRDAIPSLPSFQARVTSTTDGVVNVTAHDPESDG